VREAVGAVAAPAPPRGMFKLEGPWLALRIAPRFDIDVLIVWGWVPAVTLTGAGGGGGVGSGIFGILGERHMSLKLSF
jgi:hypothetical protein